MAVFDPTKGGGLVLKKYDSASILADPAAEMARIPQVKIAISELAGRLKVGKTKVRYAISGQSVFTRFVKLPALEEDNIDQLVTFEAQQHVPFPIDEVVWDWQLVDESGPEKEVVLVAIKADALNEVNDAVAEAGLGTGEVDASPMALYNAFRFSYPEEDQCILLVDVGAKATNLVYVEGKHLFSRSLSIGGATITTAISKEYGISFAEAETQKVSNGLVSLGGAHTEELDEPTAALATTIRNALNRLPAEVARTNNFFRSQQGGNPPQKIFLAGGCANLPYLREFLEEKLKLPIEYFNPLGNVSVGKGVDVEQLGSEAHLMGELVGLGLRGIDKAQVRIDLVPGVVEAERATARRKPFLIAASVVFLAGVAAWAGVKSYAAGMAATEAEAMEARLQPVQQLSSGLNQLNGAAERLARAGGSYAGAEDARTRWFRIIDELRGLFASDKVWITDFEPIGNFVPGEGQSGSSRVQTNFAALSYGNTALNAIKPPRPSGGPDGRGAPAPAARPGTINAIRIQGMWRDSREMQKEVNTIIGRIREASGKPGALLNLKKGKGDNAEPLEDSELLPVFEGQIQDPNELAARFTMVLPLAEEIQLPNN